ncbi:thioredoxin domain-containing protein [Shewanella xiamenensis]|uniref:thioredoxin family protein n=1 Tax=Shewanella xiamenensis TaxID=332186 RepID=UPI00244D1E1F|nr:thioredoxin domain-containing protein [Shewanella xiamenensis]MDH1316225.1 thioredoxin domain-containing protein [Shewanella xiamenensis]
MHELFVWNEDNFYHIERNEGLAVVRFFASWCPPCRDSEALFVAFAEQLDSSVTVGLVNVDHSPVLAARYEIWGLPSVLMFKDGQLIKRLAGGKSIKDYQHALIELEVATLRAYEAGSDIQESTGSTCDIGSAYQ